MVLVDDGSLITQPLQRSDTSQDWINGDPEQVAGLVLSLKNLKSIDAAQQIGPMDGSSGF